jgi:adenylylsulfate kinase-like enzyme
VLVLAIPGADRQVAEATLAVVGTVVILAAEAGKIVVHGRTSPTRRIREQHRKSMETQWLTDFNNLETRPM